jgi:hypothetical protein
MTRRGAKTTTHTPRTHAPAGGKHDLLLHRHRMLRRTASFVLARKYRFNYPGSRFECVRRGSFDRWVAGARR